MRFRAKLLDRLHKSIRSEFSKFASQPAVWGEVLRIKIIICQWKQQFHRISVHPSAEDVPIEDATAQTNDGRLIKKLKKLIKIFSSFRIEIADDL